MFRKLLPNEIDVRVQSITDKGAILLLYKDARVDQVILDETVGPMNWQRSHLRDNQNCVVSIWCKEKGLWVSKEDTGTESNTEKEKGLASDSFKRACFNWGIGRELYTSPFIFVKAEKLNLAPPKNGKVATYDKFEVGEIHYTGNYISGITIHNQKGVEVFRFGQVPTPSKDTPKPKKTVTEQPDKLTPVRVITPNEAADLLSLCGQKGVPITKIMETYGVTELANLTFENFAKAVGRLEKTPDKVETNA